MTDTGPLRAWLQKQEMSQADFGRLFEISDAHVNRICNGDPRVSAELAARIFRKTGVRVGPLRDATDADAAVVARVLFSEAAAQ